jgi:peptidoglycan/xylan/chitin deacetylase (PgdA/CDA1 family)
MASEPPGDAREEPDAEPRPMPQSPGPNMKAKFASGLRRRLKLRQRAAAARLHYERTALALVGKRERKSRGRLLCYHSVGQPEFGVNNASPQRFRRQIEFALNRGYRFIPAAEIARGEGEAFDLGITFDDGWRSVLDTAAPILNEYKIPWTLFVATGFVDEQSDWHRTHVLRWNEISDLLNMGVEIGSHSVSHPDFARIAESQAVDELERSRATIASRLGLQVECFAIPFGQSNNWTPFAQEAALRAGYKLIYAQAENTRPAGTIPRTFVTSMDGDWIFNALLEGAFDNWEEWF